jgi:hypothetical protein
MVFRKYVKLNPYLLLTLWSTHDSDLINIMREELNSILNIKNGGMNYSFLIISVQSSAINGF